MDAFTLDMVRVLIAVVDHGSFPKAAKHLNRAQSAVTYAIKKLEAQAGTPLFDRSAYRSVLTPAGRVLLVRARRIAEEADAFRDQARTLASGLEPELTLVLDSMFPLGVILDVLREFREQFPTVLPRVYVQSLGAAAQLVVDGVCQIGLLPIIVGEMTSLEIRPLVTIDLVPVVSASHPLAAFEGIIPRDEVHRHIQLVMSDTSRITQGHDYGVLSSRTWRLADIGVKKTLLLAGLGYGNMPRYLVEREVESGVLKIIQPEGFQVLTSGVVLGAAFIAETKLGPAAQWTLSRLTSLLPGEISPHLAV